MKTRRCLLSFLSILLLLPAVARAQLWSGIIDSNRAIDWTQAGLPGGTLPDSNWPICATISTYSGTDAAITSALASCHNAHPSGGVVVLGAGTFTLSTGILIPNDNLALRGQGASLTKLVFTGSDCNGGFICIKSATDGSYPQQGGSAHWASVKGGQTKGSTQLILSGLNTAVVGSILVLNQCDTGYTGGGLGAACTGTATDNGAYFHCQNAWHATNLGCAVPVEGGVNSWRSGSSEMEAVAITAINAGGCGATCVTLSKAIEQPDWGSDTQVVIIHPRVNVGVENMTLADMKTTIATGDVGVDFFNTYHCWVSGVATINFGRLGVHLYDSYGGLVKDSYFYGNPLNYGDNNAIRAVGGANNLIQNNIGHRTHGFVFPADAMPEQGDVYAYNYSPISNNWSNAHSGSNIDIHGAGGNWNLFEGNAFQGIQFDGDHGAMLSQTVFRNFLWAFNSCANGQCGTDTSTDAQPWHAAIRIYFGARYNNIVGGVYGTPGYSTIYKSSDSFANDSIYIWGAGQSAGGYNQPQDALVNSTTLLWANWDVVNNATQCNNSEVPTSAPTYPNSTPTLGCGGGSLPASFYLSSKPGWWPSNVAYPPIGPDVVNGNIGQCSGGTLGNVSQAGLPATQASQCSTGVKNPAWAGHVNANPAMACYFSMGGLPDGTGPALSFNGSACYGTSSSLSSNPPSPTNLVVTVN